MGEELVSVIIPIYNSEKYLQKCVNSVLSQKYSNLEILLIDDGSNDKSLDICKEFIQKDSRIKLLSQENKGVSSARNLGLDNANGKYIQFIDADDYMEANMIENMYNGIIKYSCDIFICNYYLVTENDKTQYDVKDMNNCEFDSYVFRKNLHEPNCYGGYLWNKLIKREVIDNIRFDEKIHVMEDLLFLDEISRNVKKAYFKSDWYLYNYVQRENSAVNNIYSNKYKSTLDALKLILDRLEGLDFNLYSKYKFDYIYVYMNIYYANYTNKLRKVKNKDLKDVRKNYLKDALSTKYYNWKQKVKLLLISHFPMFYNNLKKIIK